MFRWVVVVVLVVVVVVVVVPRSLHMFHPAMMFHGNLTNYHNLYTTGIAWDIVEHIGIIYIHVINVYCVLIYIYVYSPVDVFMCCFPSWDDEPQ
jgi:lipoprotein signal peptidase